MGYISYTRTIVAKHINYTFNDSTTVNNRYLKVANTFSNESSFVLPCNAILESISVNTLDLESCTFYVRRNGNPINVAWIVLINEKLKSVNTNVQFYKDDKIEVFCMGSSKKPTLTVYFETSC
jgi:hypothetical protein